MNINSQNDTYHESIMNKIGKIKKIIGYEQDYNSLDVVEFPSLVINNYTKEENASYFSKIRSISQNIIHLIDDINEIFLIYKADTDVIKQYFSLFMGDINFILNELQKASMDILLLQDRKEDVFGLMLISWQISIAFGAVLYGDCENVIDHVNWTSMGAFGVRFEIENS